MLEKKEQRLFWNPLNIHSKAMEPKFRFLLSFTTELQSPVNAPNIPKNSQVFMFEARKSGNEKEF